MGVPQSVVDFYDERYWNFPFGEWGRDYTIALAPSGGGYHIGLDLAAGDGEAIPALVGGTVHSVVLTGTMAWVVVVHGDDGRYYFYCHIANDNRPAVGQRLEQGDRVGRAANGPKGISAGNPDFPGSAWNGRHVHLVVTDNPYAAYSYVPGYRTLDAFTDPAVIIRSILAQPSGGGAKPFTPSQSEEDDMKIITDGKGAQKFVDEFGADDIGAFFYVPNGINNDPTWVQNILASYKLAGQPEDVSEPWLFDLTRHIADARWASKRGQIVGDVVVALKPLFAEIASAVAGVTPERFEELIEKGLDGVVVKAEPMSEADQEKLAKLILDRQAERLAK